MKKTMIISVLAALLAAPVIADINVVSYPAGIIDAASGTVDILWADSITTTTPVYSAELVYGTGSGVYTNSIAQDSNGFLSFNPAAEGMAGGAYYFRVSSTTAGIAMSNEYRLFIGAGGGVGVNDIAFLPNPFSPNIAPLQISYRPWSDVSANVKITIKAYNMAGKHLATIVDGAMRTTGAVNTDTWNGTDLLGYKCKNGRYIIQIEVEDGAGKKQYLATVVMVK